MNSRENIIQQILQKIIYHTRRMSRTAKVNWEGQRHRFSLSWRTPYKIWLDYLWIIKCRASSIIIKIKAFQIALSARWLLLKKKKKNVYFKTFVINCFFCQNKYKIQEFEENLILEIEPNKKGLLSFAKKRPSKYKLQIFFFWKLNCQWSSFLTIGLENFQPFFLFNSVSQSQNFEYKMRSPTVCSEKTTVLSYSKFWLQGTVSGKPH